VENDECSRENKVVKCMSDKVKVQLVLDMFHLLETMIGNERIQEMTLEEALKLKDDTICLLEGRMTPSEYKKIWKLKG